MINYRATINAIEAIYVNPVTAIGRTLRKFVSSLREIS